MIGWTLLSRILGTVRFLWPTEILDRDFACRCATFLAAMDLARDRDVATLRRCAREIGVPRRRSGIAVVRQQAAVSKQVLSSFRWALVLITSAHSDIVDGKSGHLLSNQLDSKVRLRVAVAASLPEHSRLTLVCPYRCARTSSAVCRVSMQFMGSGSPILTVLMRGNSQEDPQPPRPSYILGAARSWSARTSCRLICTILHTDGALRCPQTKTTGRGGKTVGVSKKK